MQAARRMRNIRPTQQANGEPYKRSPSLPSSVNASQTARREVCMPRVEQTLEAVAFTNGLASEWRYRNSEITITIQGCSDPF